MHNIDLLDLTPAQGFKISGAVVGDYAGGSVSSVGDINGDGIADLVVGAFYANPNSRSDAGAVYVIYGKSGGLGDIDLASLSAEDGFRISGAAAYDYAGYSVSSAGDINSDGIDDLVVGARGVSYGERAGAAYVIYGKSGGLNDLDLASLTSTQGFKISGAAADDETGCSVSSAGDINGDGIDDLVIGAFWADPSGRDWAGAVYVIYGKNGGLNDLDLASLTSTQGFKISGATEGDCTGYSVSNAGDINGDGIDDLIIGAYEADSSGRDFAGAVYVIYGKNGGLSDIDLLSLTAVDGFKISGAAEGDCTGYSVSNAGDINGDGIADLVVGVPWADSSGRDFAGAVYVIYGKNGGLSDIDLLSLTAVDGFKISGAAEGDCTGYSVSNAGDINGDGIADLVVGAYEADPSGRERAGAAYVIYGKNGGLSDIDLLSLTAVDGFKISGAAEGDCTGYSVSNAGDINGDGIADLVVGAYEADPSGRNLAGAVYVIYGDVNDAPIVTTLSKIGTEDTALTFDATDFTIHYTDIDGDSLTKIQITSLPSGGILKVLGSTVTLNQEIMVGNLGSLVFELIANWYGTTSFSWKGHDGTVYSTSAANVNITVNAINDAPTVMTIPKIGTEDAALTFTTTDFTNHFSDVDNDGLIKIQVISLPTNGDLKLSGISVVEDQEINTDNIANLTFEPNENWNGNTTFEWKGHDGTEYSESTANVEITIGAVNDAPTVTTIPKIGIEDTTLTFTTTDFTNHFSDVDNDSLTKIQAVSLPSNGDLRLSDVSVVENQEIDVGDLNTLTFVPNSNWNGATSFEWKGHDGTEYSTSAANVDITINAVNDAPTVTTIPKIGTEDTTLTFSTTDFTTHFDDVDNDSLTKIQVISLPGNGNLKLSGISVIENQEINVANLNNLTFEPNENWYGTTSFSWKGHDGTVYSTSTANVNITINAVNDAPPIVTTFSKIGTEDIALIFTALDFTSHFNDIDEDSLIKIQITNLPSQGGTLKVSGSTVTLNQEIMAGNLGSLVFELIANWYGTTSFSWKGHDGTVYSTSAANVNITVNAINDAPTVMTIPKIGTEDTTLTFSTTDFTSHFSDVDNDNLTKIQVISLPSNGDLKLSDVSVVENQEINVANLNALTFEPNENWNGDTSFSWKGYDGTEYSTSAANVDITIDAVNDAPTVTTLSKIGTEDTALIFTTTDFTSYFSDIDNDSLTKIQVVSLPSNGDLKLSGVSVVEDQEISIANLNALTFESSANWYGTTSFSWKGYDGTVYSISTANVDITINAQNDVPTISTFSKSGTEDTIITFTALEFTSHFSDIDGDSLARIKVMNLPNNGILKLSGNPVLVNQEILAGDLPSLIFEPNINWYGSTSFSWKGHDGTEYSESTANVDITLNAQNDIPTISTFFKSGTEDTIVTFTASDFTSHFNDIDGDSLARIKVMNLPNNGILKLSGNSVLVNQEILAGDLPSLIFEPNINWYGSTSFSWKGHDGTEYSSNSANVILSINAIPILINNNLIIDEGGTVILTMNNLRATDVDSNDNLLIFLMSNIQNGRFELVSNTEVAITQFTQQQVQYGQVQVVHNGGEDALSYNIVVTDGAATTFTFPGDVIFNPVNDAPIVTTISKIGTEGTALTFDATDFTIHYTDIEGSALTKIKVMTLPSDGILKSLETLVEVNQEIDVSDLNNLTFEPNENWNGNTSFEWKGYDGTVYSTSAANVDITINAVNDAPIITTISKTGTEDTVLIFTTTDFTSHFSDIDNDSLTKIQVVNLPSNGDLKISAILVVENQEINVANLNVLTFEPNENWYGTTSFSWQGHDGTVYSISAANVDITINAQNDIPTISTFFKSGTEDTIVTFTALDFTSHFSDIDGDSLIKVQIITLPNNGILKLSGNPVSVNQEILAGDLTSLTFEPNTNWYGSTSFGWKGHDGTEYSESTANVDITLNAQNDIPTISTFFKSGTEDTVVTFTASDFTNHFSDIDGDSLTKIQIVALPSQGGTLKISGTAVTLYQEILVNNLGYLTFEPNENWYGTTSFEWKGHDGTEYSESTANVDITIGAVNDAPILGHNFIEIEQGQTITLSSENLSATDVDNEDNSLIFIVDNVLYGRFELSTGRGRAIYQFTQQQIRDGEVNFVHDGSSFSPSYSVSVSDGIITTSSSIGTVDFTVPESLYCEDNPFVCYVIPPLGTFLSIAVTAVIYFHKKQLCCFKKKGAVPIPQTSVQMVTTTV